SGQMHSLVLLDKNNHVLRNAILWNDTRTTAEGEEIYDVVGKERLLEIAKNSALEGFTLPKLLWVKKHEPDLFAKAAKFVLPKDYIRYKLTGKLHMEYSDAAGTRIVDVSIDVWSETICDLLDLYITLGPPLVESYGEVGKVVPEYAYKTRLARSLRLLAGGAENACGAIGSG